MVAINNHIHFMNPIESLIFLGVKTYQQNAFRRYISHLSLAKLYFARGKSRLDDRFRITN